jgi:hypothetical protein
MMTWSRYLVLLVVMSHDTGINDALRIMFISSRIRIRVVLLVERVLVLMLLLMLVLIVILVPMHGIGSRVMPVRDWMVNQWVATAVAASSICRSVPAWIWHLDSAFCALMNFRVL